MGVENPEAIPWAELWMGSHPASPSMVCLGQHTLSLADLVAGDARHYLGEKGAQVYGSLPFLFKLLAAEQPLSIQAHPNLAQAREGFRRESGRAIDDPARNYRDANHKPEIVCALTPFSGLCGFRAPFEIHRLLTDFLGFRDPVSTGAPAHGGEGSRGAQRLLCNGAAPLLRALENTGGKAALRGFLAELFSLEQDMRKQLSEYIAKAGPPRLAAARYAQDTELSPEIWETIIRFNELYPCDPAIIAPLYLNLFRLRPGEAVFLRAGTLHTYIHGFAVELMANSDNVLRGGLTPKHVDPPELMKILDFSPMKPEIITPPESAARYTYPAPCEEFSLTIMRSRAGGEMIFDAAPAICIVTAGAAEIAGKSSRVFLKAGESVFIPPSENLPVFRGEFTLYAASLPAEPSRSGDNPRRE